MKLEEVLPHLRAGGEVTSEQIVKGLYTAPKRRYSFKLNHKRLETFDDIERISVNLDVAFDINDFEIVKNPYKKEHIIEVINTNFDYKLDGAPTYGVMTKIIPNISNKKYKVTIEEIKE